MPAELIHEVFPVGLLQCNCSILGDPATHEAIVVDPGDEVEHILEILRRHDLNVRAIVSTHTHIDHVGGLAGLHRATGAPILIHQADLELYRRLDLQAQWLGLPAPATARIEDFLNEGDTLRWGRFAARVLHTPGHTLGSISLVVESGPEESGNAQASVQPEQLAQAHSYLPETTRLLAGDTLFRGSIGRTDLWGGSYSQILRSIREKLLTLADEVAVYPGHGDVTSIGTERAHNPFLRSSVS